MVPLVRAAALAKTFGGIYCRAVIRRPLMGEAELKVRSLDSKTTGPDRGSPVASSQWSRSRATAFTLIELTVVILVIATLAALTLTAASGVVDRAKKVQAKNDIIQIVTAVNAFYTEYGRYPVTVPPSNTTDAFFGTGAAPTGCTSYTTNDKLFNVLRS